MHTLNYIKFAFNVENNVGKMGTSKEESEKTCLLLKVFNIEFPANLFLGIQPRELKTHTYTKTVTQIIIHSSQKVETTHMPIN